MRRIKAGFLASMLLATSAVAANGEVNVVASIRPVHSLVAAVMEGIGEPGLIIEGAGSPHSYALKPSQARMLESANVVFWVGHELEAFLEKPLETVGANAKSVELIDAHDLVKLGLREGGAFDEHDRETSAGTDHDADHDHGHGEFNPHLWLDPVNAKAMVHEIEEALIAADPANAAKYQANAEAVTARLDHLIAEVGAELEPVRGKGFIVFHDAYQYFENRFGVRAAGSITVSPEVMPGAARVSEIRAKVQELGAACVFAEPQFEPKLVSTVIEGTQARSGVLDPLGAELETGQELYFQLIRNMAGSIKACLSQAS